MFELECSLKRKINKNARDSNLLRIIKRRTSFTNIQINTLSREMCAGQYIKFFRTTAT